MWLFPRYISESQFTMACADLINRPPQRSQQSVQPGNSGVLPLLIPNGQPDQHGPLSLTRRSMPIVNLDQMSMAELAGPIESSRAATRALSRLAQEADIDCSPRHRRGKDGTSPNTMVGKPLDASFAGSHSRDSLQVAHSVLLPDVPDGSHPLYGFLGPARRSATPGPQYLNSCPPPQVSQRVGTTASLQRSVIFFPHISALHC